MPRPLPLRAEQPPDSAAVVIRGGVLSAASVEAAASRSLELFGVLGISVEGAIGVTVLEACRSSERLAAYRHIRLSTFGRVRSGGFAMLASFDFPHYTLVLPDLSELTLARLDRLFDEPIPNPGRDPRGSV